MTAVHVVLPFRSDDPDRLDACEWVHNWYRRTFPDWPVTVADSTGGWSKPRALNQTIDGIDCDMLVVADADVFIDPARLARAVRQAGWCVPHHQTIRLDRDATQTVYAGGQPDPARTVKKPYRSVAGGGMFTISRDGWDAAGGFDERFTGWGCEDQAFAVAADRLHRPHVRLRGPLWHLYHPPGLRKHDPTFPANKARLRRYRTTRSRTGLRQLIAQNRRSHVR